MADHVRKQLRDAVAARVFGLSTTGANVFASRVWPLSHTELPALLVYVTTETVTPEALEAPDLQRREFEIRVEGIAEAVGTLDDTLDAIAKEVEVALASPLSVASRSISLTYTGSEVDFDGETEAETGAILMKFVVDLYTAADAPDALIQA